MRIYDIQRNKRLVMLVETYREDVLPWDLKSIFDCDLNLDDVDFLQSGGTLQVGVVTLRLEDTVTC